LGIEKNEQFFESQAADVGLELVEKNQDKVFKVSDGAIVYDGEKVGLHTRVFITSKNLPTYETKDLGLAFLKQQKYPDSDQSLIITAHEQSEYFKVMLAALKEIDEKLAGKTKHLYHGFVSLSSGKMSSRSGEVYSATSLIVDVDQAVRQAFDKKDDNVRNAAIKYGLLKHRLGSDIVYEVSESISIEGDSGPYLQYAYARARSILAKAESRASKPERLEVNERGLARKIGEYAEVVENAAAELLPSHITTYLYELAQTFNRFYENNRVVGDSREAERLFLVGSYAKTVKEGLKLLGIEAPERM
jgi:arginyl-tRNA synthetase